jgi:hypothetical protein
MKSAAELGAIFRERRKKKTKTTPKTLPWWKGVGYVYFIEGAGLVKISRVFK